MPIEDPILMELRGINAKLAKLIETFDDSGRSHLEDLGLFEDEDEDEDEDDTVGDENIPTPEPPPGMQPVPYLRLVK
jgi:hypothetical protein